MKCAIFAIGNEILEGSIVDTNSAFLAKNLSDLGFNVFETKALPDNKSILVENFKDALETYNLTITTGGLGPTFDDLTAEAVAIASNRNFVFYEEVYKSIEEKLTSRGVSVKESHKRQAYLPDNCLLFKNDKGTAFGFGVNKGGNWIISLPGIPYEMHHMFLNYVKPFILDTFKLKQIYKKDLKFTGIPESDVDATILELKKGEDPEVIINTSKGMIIVRIRSFNKEVLNQFVNKLKEKLGNYYFGEDDDTLESVILKKLIYNNLTLSTVESCTGGLIAKKITDIPGSSKAFLGSIIAYSNEVKNKILNVSHNTLENYGAVSAECCKEMISGCSNIFNSDIVIATTGIAGPDGGSDEKPVGTVFIGIKFKSNIVINKYHFNGDRETIRERTANTAFRLLLELLNEK